MLATTTIDFTILCNIKIAEKPVVAGFLDLIFRTLVYGNTFKPEKMAFMQTLGDEEIGVLDGIYRHYEDLDERMDEYKNAININREHANFQLQTFWSFYQLNRDKILQNIEIMLKRLQA